MRPRFETQAGARSALLRSAQAALLGGALGCGAPPPPPIQPVEEIRRPPIDCAAAAVPLCRADPIVASLAQGRRRLEAYQEAAGQGSEWDAERVRLLAEALPHLAAAWDQLEQEMAQACRATVQCECEGRDCTQEDRTRGTVQGRVPELFDGFLRWQGELAGARPSLVLRPPVPAADSAQAAIGYRITRYEYDVDLRDRYEAASDSARAGRSRAAVTHRIRLVRTDAAADTLRLRMNTTGSRLGVSSPTHACVVEPAAVPDSHYQGMALGRRIVKVPIRADPLGQEYEIELRATHWNAFPGSEWEWFALPGLGSRVKASILFPAAKAGSRPRFFEYPEGEVPAPIRVETEATSRFAASPDSLTWSWTIQDPNPLLTYEIRWSW